MEPSEYYLNATPAPVEFTLGELRAFGALMKVAVLTGVVEAAAVLASPEQRLATAEFMKKTHAAIIEHGELDAEGIQHGKDQQAQMTAGNDQLRAEIEGLS